MRLVAILLSMAMASTAFAQTPDYIGKHQSTTADLQAIKEVIESFRTSIVDKDTKRLSSLMLDSYILWNSPPNSSNIKDMQNNLDVTFNGVMGSGLRDFIIFLHNEKQPVEEKFYNIKITQDDNVAWVAFDYEFQMDHKTENYGIETWQLIRDADSHWKIISVVWSAHLTKDPSNKTP